MWKYIRPFRNKYLLAFALFLGYNLFLDELDIFTLVSENKRYSKLKEDNVLITQKLRETKTTYHNLRNIYSLEKYAREEKLFKRDDEDIFVITRE